MQHSTPHTATMAGLLVLQQQLETTVKQITSLNTGYLHISQSYTSDTRLVPK
jgi:hypothetical protein